MAGVVQVIAAFRVTESNAGQQTLRRLLGVAGREHEGAAADVDQCAAGGWAAVRKPGGILVAADRGDGDFTGQDHAMVIGYRLVM